ncbi:TetR family transcriptional regulator (plasmid) [Neorhizobium sp. SOG26]|uniref:TetR-like C-terminal domain-containing protein n=1 Tax=Neorhizobium sp. SOG26 TaxID=2060726 RepID=UPI000E567DB2|nr:TetR/AcrR family transcriptional regulator [Neorhizobium sp. SOG26]AXV17827.1 TetR family transcriptional regulator [Neorhizobium sp. SOG26]
MARTLIRPGGRSERIQLAVHKAVRELTEEQLDQHLTVAMIAARAQVPPSTIYRRWQTLQQLLADVASERFLPDTLPIDTGTLEGDLTLWLEHLVDDLSSGPGNALLRERMTDVRAARVAAGYAYQNLVLLCGRCEGRGEPAPIPDRLMDLLVAPVIYRIFFAGQTISSQYQAELVHNALQSPIGIRPFDAQASIKDYVLYEDGAQ